MHAQIRPNVWLIDAGLREVTLEGRRWLGGDAFLRVQEPRDENVAAPLVATLLGLDFTALDGALYPGLLAD